MTAPLRPGDPEQVGPYRLLGLLGEGGQGSVFLAEDTGGAIPGRVAVKLLHARFTGDARARSRFAAEVAVAKRVSPFCTARVLDADVEGHTPYIVSEYIDGPSLQSVLNSDGPRTGPELVRLAIGTITSLAAIHEAGVVHRDFKPSNVLLAPDGPRLIDFGVARALDATGTLSSTAVGTPAYMAPEQIAGHQVGPAADVFAWGAAMVYAASGRAPFGQDSIPAVMHRILHFPPDLGELADPLREIVALCLVKDPAGRPTAFQVLMRLLHQAGAVPPQQPQQTGEAMLHQGAEVAAAATPPALVHPAPGLAGHWMPPPPPPGPAPYGTDPAGPRQGPTHPGGGPFPGTPGPPRKGIGKGVLAGSAAAALVTLVLVGSVAAVQLLERRSPDPTRSPAGGRTGGEFTAIVSPPEQIDPSNAQWGATDRTLVKQLFTGLVEITPTGTVRPRLATAITPDEACRNWTIKIRQGTAFSDGEAVDAAAFVRGWSRAARSKVAFALSLMGDIEGYRDAADGGTFTGVSAAGADTLRVRLTGSNCEFPRRLGDPMFFPVPVAAGEPDNAAYNDKPIGNGPFRLDSYDKSRQAVLLRNDAWAFGKTRLDRVTFRFSSDTTAAVRGVGTGEADWTTVPSSALGQARGSGAYVHAKPSTGLNFLVPITDRGPLKSREARLAISYALDRKSLTETFSAGLYTPATGILPRGFSGYAQSGACPSCAGPDPERAKRLAAQAGLGPGTEMPILVRSGSPYEQWATLVERQLERTLGWTVTINTVADFTAQTNAIKDRKTVGLVPMGWLADYPSPYSFLQPLLAGDQVPPAGSNYSFWKNGSFDDALRAAVGESDANARVAAFRRAERIALDDMAIIPLWNLANIRLATNRFVGLTMDLDGDPILSAAGLK